MTRLLPWLGLFIATTLFACGGKVVVDGSATGEGGAGGTGSGASTGTSPSTGTVPSTSTGPDDLCAQFCSFWDQQGCPMSECAAQCAMAFQAAGPCADELTAAVQCILSNPTKGCNTPEACAGAINAYQMCVEPTTCSGLGCFMGSDGSCGCKGQCNGSNVAVECSGGVCSCFLDGNQVGSCKEANPTCDPQAGCCGPILFGPGI